MSEYNLVSSGFPLWDELPGILLKHFADSPDITAQMCNDGCHILI